MGRKYRIRLKIALKTVNLLWNSRKIITMDRFLKKRLQWRFLNTHFRNQGTWNLKKYKFKKKILILVFTYVWDFQLIKLLFKFQTPNFVDWCRIVYLYNKRNIRKESPNQRNLPKFHCIFTKKRKPHYIFCW